MKTTTSGYESTYTVDLIKELSSNCERYTGAENFRLDHGWLIFELDINLGRVSVRVEPRPTFSTVVACCNFARHKSNPIT